MESCAHRSIRHCLAMTAPFYPHPDCSAEGQRQFHNFIRSIYHAMLKEPENYFVFPAPYEAYMEKNRQRLSEMRGLKNHYSDSRESTLRNTFQQAIQFYAIFLYELGKASLPEESRPDRLSLLPENHCSIMKKMERIHDAKWNAQRYERLLQHGLKIMKTENRVYYTAEAYPEMMAGLLFLCKAKENKYHFMNYLRLDFKNAGSMPDMKDILLTLPEENQNILLFMQETAGSLGLKIKEKLRPLRGITSDFQWKMEFTSKGKNIWSFYADQDILKICIYLGTPEKISDLADKLMHSHPSFLSWYQDQFALRTCKCPYNRAVHLGNIKKRICGLSNRMEMDNPKLDDLKNAEKILNLLYQSEKIENI